VEALTYLYVYRLIPHARVETEFMEFCLCALSYGQLKALKAALGRMMAEIPGFALERIHAMSPNRSSSFTDAVMAVARELESARDTKPGEALAEIFHPVMRTEMREKMSLAASARKRLSYLASVFQLSRREVDMILFYFCHSWSSSFNGIYCSNEWLQDIRLCAVAVATPETQFVELTSDRGKLVRSGILAKSKNHYGAIRFNWLSDGIREYLEEGASYPLHEKYSKKDTGALFPYGSFTVGKTERTVLLALMRSGGPKSLLFFGEPGTGKSEFARSLCAEAGRSAYLLKIGDKDSVVQRCANLLLASHTIDPELDVLIVDEADGILNTDFDLPGAEDTVSKAWLNSMLDASRITMIWITNGVHRMDPSVRRRFSFALPFKPFTSEQREALWTGLAGKSLQGAHLSAETLGRVAREYCINAAGIASALQTLEEVFPSLSRGEIAPEKMLTTLVEHRLEVQRDASQSTRPSPLFTADALNLDMPADAVLAAVERRLELSNATGGRAPLCLLFWGPPGTGKSELARYLASHAGRRLDVRPASKLLSMYVGETEHNIAVAFRSAEEEGAILLLDEADSFLFSRDRSYYRWEASQTNELLMSMENFNGVLICCTNRLEGLDPAALRRFVIKVEFRPLTSDRARLLFARHFPDHAITAAEDARLSGMKLLTPGDFKAARLRLEAADMLQPERMIEELDREQRYKPTENRTVGF
jgi:AAA+ superfamily predicted ATPase